MPGRPLKPRHEVTRRPHGNVQRLQPHNNVRRLREEQLLTKAELARKAGISPLTVARIESGLECRMDTQRKIILALGYTPSDRNKVFGLRGRGGRV